MMKPLVWVGSSKKNFLTFPDDVVNDVGYALCLTRVATNRSMPRPLEDSAVLASEKSLSNTTGTRIERRTQSLWKMPSIFCIASRRSRKQDQQRLNKTLI